MIRRRPLHIFMAVQKALFLRELSMKFSSGKTGLFWTFFQPFLMIVVFVAIKSLLFGDGGGNFDFSVFLALNFTAFNMFKDIVTSSSNAFMANRPLFIYKQVKPIDTTIARTLVEVFITSIIIIIFVIIGFYFDFDMNVESPNMVVVGFIFLILFAYAFGLFVAVGNVFFLSIGKVVSLLLTALMFGSAVFFTLESLPGEIREWLLYNPLVHFMEMIHGSYFEVLDDRYVDYTYMSLWTLTLLYAGLWLYRKLEQRIISL